MEALALDSISRSIYQNMAHSIHGLNSAWKIDDSEQVTHCSASLNAQHILLTYNTHSIDFN